MVHPEKTNMHFATTSHQADRTKFLISSTHARTSYIVGHGVGVCAQGAKATDGPVADLFSLPEYVAWHADQAFCALVVQFSGQRDPKLSYIAAFTFSSSTRLLFSFMEPRRRRY